nr:MAG TPA: hypothetical protein [Caudoviricetes sp.]
MPVTLSVAMQIGGEDAGPQLSTLKSQFCPFPML